MKHPVEIGKHKFVSKKEALLHYKTILNSYELEENLNKDDFAEMLALLDKHPRVKEKIGVGIKTIKIAKVKYNSRCFEIIRDDNSTEYFSYIRLINAPMNDFTKFNRACRELVKEDVRIVKLSYFQKFSRKGRVKCQETGELLKWEELSIDHRQPNTFSVIVDRFIELNNLNLSKIEYFQDGGDLDEIVDKELKEKFREYHKEKANLRIVKKSLNLSRTFQARIKRQNKDLRIE